MVLARQAELGRRRADVTSGRDIRVSQLAFCLVAVSERAGVVEYRCGELEFEARSGCWASRLRAGSGCSPDVRVAGAAARWGHGPYLLHHRHEPDECGVVFTSSKGHDSRSATGPRLASCRTGGHAIWRTVDADSEEDAPAAAVLRGQTHNDYPRQRSSNPMTAAPKQSPPTRTSGTWTEPT